MASTMTPNISALLQKSSIDDHQEILKACNASLKKSKNDVDVQLVKAVALIKLDQYKDALDLFEAAGTTLKDKGRLEYAYTLYKAGRLEEAAETAASSAGHRGALHLEAQAAYRSEDFSRTAEIYKNLAVREVSQEEFDLRVNRGAVDAQKQWLGGNDSIVYNKPGREDLEAFETAYNAACGSIARGEFRQAEVLLKRAKELCKHSEDLSPEQKVEELLPISVQQLYVLQVSGKTEEAEAVASDIKAEDTNDYSTRKIAHNNQLVSSSASANPFLAHKTFHSTPEIPEKDKLFSYQARTLLANEKAIDLQSFKFDGVAASTTQALLKHHLPSTAPDAAILGALNAAAHARNEVGNVALKRVLPELEKRPNDVGLILTIVQLYSTTGNSTAAIHLMESFFKRLEDSIGENDQDVRFAPGLVSTLIGLYRIQGRKSHIKQELAKAASYWRHKSKPPASMLHVAGASLLESGTKEDVSTAKEIFTKLHEQYPEDKAAVAGYVASRAMASPEDVQADAEKLTSVAELTKNIDVDALEKAGIPQSSNALAIAQLGTSRKRAAPSGAASKPKRIRQSRLPKDYDPEKKPDPERWLPLRDRSTYRPKGKKKGKKTGDDRTQGGVVTDDVGVSTVAPAKPVVTAAGGANKKKKGKGKK